MSLLWRANSGSICEPNISAVLKTSPLKMTAPIVSFSLTAVVNSGGMNRKETESFTCMLTMTCTFSEKDGVPWSLTCTERSITPGSTTPLSSMVPSSAFHSNIAPPKVFCLTMVYESCPFAPSSASLQLRAARDNLSYSPSVIKWTNVSSVQIGLLSLTSAMSIVTLIEDVREPAIMSPSSASMVSLNKGFTSRSTNDTSEITPVSRSTTKASNSGSLSTMV